MTRFTQEQKAAIQARMLAPESASPKQLSVELSIGESTLYRWRSQLHPHGVNAMPSKSTSTPSRFSSLQKFAVVLDTASMNAHALSVYCREKGLLVEEVSAWRKACEQANGPLLASKPAKAQTQQIAKLERELSRKDKALAEAAALLVLRKKLDAFYLQDEDA
jgi:transposase